MFMFLSNWEQSMTLHVVMFPGSLWFENVWKLELLRFFKSRSKHLWTCQKFLSNYCCAVFTSAGIRHSKPFVGSCKNQEITLSSILSTAVERWEVPCSAMGWVRMLFCYVTGVCLRMTSIFWCQSGKKWLAYIYDFIQSSICASINESILTYFSVHQEFVQYLYSFIYYILYTFDYLDV